jgi:hypothetical protein
MLLHAAPENDVREARELAPCNGLWLWDAAAAQAAPVPTRVVALAATGAAGDLARGLALATGSTARDIGASDRVRAALPAASSPATSVASGAATLDATLDAARQATHVVVALPAVTAASFAAVDMQWLAPAVEALLDGRAGALTLLVDGRGAHAFGASRPRGWRRVAARWRRARFAIDG